MDLKIYFCFPVIDPGPGFDTYMAGIPDPGIAGRRSTHPPTLSYYTYTLFETCVGQFLIFCFNYIDHLEGENILMGQRLRRHGS